MDMQRIAKTWYLNNVYGFTTVKYLWFLSCVMMHIARHVALHVAVLFSNFAAQRCVVIDRCM
jgi:hypothetical protein